MRSLMVRLERLGKEVSHRSAVGSQGLGWKGQVERVVILY
jgi:hypothetical protein